MTLFAAATRFDQDFSIDRHLLISGESVHFFTGPPVQKFSGFYLRLTGLVPISDHVLSGGSLGVHSWTTKYCLNWELPDRGLALEPMKSNLYGLYLEGSFLIAGRLDRLTVFPFLGASIGFSAIEVDVEGQVETGSAFYWAGSAGAEARLRLVSTVFMTVGYKTNLLLNTEPAYEIEEGLKLRSRFGRVRQEAYVGLGLKVAEIDGS